MHGISSSKMKLCRICLSTAAHNDICELKTSKKDNSKSYVEILSFCLDIQITEETKVTTKLCQKCYRKILSYHKFKTIALQNDKYLKTLNLDCAIKLEKLIDENEECSNIMEGPITTNDDIELCNDDLLVNEVKDGYDFPSHDIKDEPIFKAEIDTNNDQSDDELLSVIKKIKEEDSSMLSKTAVSEENNIIKKGNQIIQDNIFSGSCLIKGRKIGRSKWIEPVKAKKQICEECGELVVDLKQHSQRHIPSEDRKLLKCKACDKTFHTKGARSKHYKTKHLGIRYRCEICGKDVVSLQSHVLRMHKQDQLKFTCVLCDRRFLSKSLLDIHMHSHTKDKPFECDICQQRYRLKIILLQHKRRVHDKEKPHLCQFCSKRFFSKHHLQLHIRTHTKEKPYKCEECGAAFSTRTTYKNHKQTHGTEKNFQCEQCDMKFLRRAYLRNHMVCHSKEKRYPCKYCGVRFGRSDHRKRHQFTAHEKFILAAA